MNNNKSQINHIVVFKYKPNVTIDKQAEILNKFLDLKNECKKDGKTYINSIVGGNCSNSIEGLDQGFHQAFIVTFGSQSDFEYYIGRPFYKSFDPKHDEFKEFVTPYLAVDENNKTIGAMVFDFKI
jgi:hypothetical protein